MDFLTLVGTSKMSYVYAHAISGVEINFFKRKGGFENRPSKDIYFAFLYCFNFLVNKGH